MHFTVQVADSEGNSNAQPKSGTWLLFRQCRIASPDTQSHYRLRGFDISFSIATISDEERMPNPLAIRTRTSTVGDF